jgi:hypothetical protein
VHGLLAAAAGVTRDQVRPAWIRDAQLAVRVDRPGSVLRDFHTINPPDRDRYARLSSHDQDKVRTVVKASGAEHTVPVVTERYYRQDQAVVVFVEDPDQAVYDILNSPAFTLYAGRKACTLSFPFVLGCTTVDLESALAEVPTTAPAGGKLEAVLFTEPQRLPVYKEPVFRPEMPAGRVAESYLMQARYSVLVDPPRVGSWFDVLDFLTPNAVTGDSGLIQAGGRGNVAS